MLTRYPEPETAGDTSPKRLEKLAGLRSHTLYVVLDAGPEDNVSGKFYDECYGEVTRRERAAIDSLALDVTADLATVPAQDPEE